MAPHVYPAMKVVPAAGVTAKALMERHWAFVIAPGDVDEPPEPLEARHAGATRPTPPVR